MPRGFRPIPDATNIAAELTAMRVQLRELVQRAALLPEADARAAQLDERAAQLFAESRNLLHVVCTGAHPVQEAS